jgi:pristinamycin I synthase-3/4
VRRVLDACPDVVIRAMYGVTECSLFSAHNPLTASFQPGMLVPIGNAFDDVRIHIVDDRLTPVPNGVEGEVYIAGRGVSRGYFGRTDLTAEVFVADPFGEPGTRMYRTGDLARRNDDGLIELVGRASSQVKILGFRVELAEVEAAVASFPGLAQVVVVVLELETGEKRLVGYVVSESGDVDLGALRARVKESLPDYMIPAAFVQLPSLPLTANGKLDRKAMPEPDFEAAAAYRAPETPLQESLCAIFGSVLEVAKVGIDDSFFDIGGQSLQAMRLLSRVRAEIGVDLLINVLFDIPTVAGLADHIEAAAAA